MGGINIEGRYFSSRGFADAVGTGPPSNIRPNRIEELFRRMLPEAVQSQEETPLLPIGNLNSRDWRILAQLARQEACTTGEVCKGVAAVLAKQSVDPHLVESRLVHLTEVNWCSREILPDGSCGWRLTKQAAKQFLPQPNGTTMR